MSLDSDLHRHQLSLESILSTDHLDTICKGQRDLPETQPHEIRAAKLEQRVNA